MSPSRSNRSHFFRDNSMLSSTTSCSASSRANANLHGSGNIAEDEDDLDVLVRRVDALPAGTEVRRVASTEARGLKRIPPQCGARRREELCAYLCFSYPRIVSDTTLSSNGLPLCLGPHRHLVRIPLQGPTSSPTQSRNSTRITLVLIKSSDGLRSTSLLSACVR